ncbi:hypothetical protein PHISP_00654 [Aspergillus sp. HF37]|nr:hypothetical protein PHISP_00654 [Aspergillus sp. HF37]
MTTMGSPKTPLLVTMSAELRRYQGPKCGQAMTSHIREAHSILLVECSPILNVSQRARWEELKVEKEKGQTELFELRGEKREKKEKAAKANEELEEVGQRYKQRQERYFQVCRMVNNPEELI